MQVNRGTTHSLSPRRPGAICPIHAHHVGGILSNGVMLEWVLIAVMVLGAAVLATHTAAVAFVVSRIVFSGRPKQKQFSPKQ